jgi:hypothetical protein
MAGQLIDKKSAGEFQNELEEEIEHGPSRLPLIGQFEKPGKASLSPNRTRVQLFPSWRACRDFLC